MSTTSSPVETRPRIRPAASSGPESAPVASDRDRALAGLERLGAEGAPQVLGERRIDRLADHAADVVGLEVGRDDLHSVFSIGESSHCRDGRVNPMPVVLSALLLISSVADASGWLSAPMLARRCAAGASAMLGNRGNVRERAARVGPQTVRTWRARRAEVDSLRCSAAHQTSSAACSSPHVERSRTPAQFARSCDRAGPSSAGQSPLRGDRRSEASAEPAPAASRARSPTRTA